MTHLTYVISDRKIGGAARQLLSLSRALCDEFSVRIYLSERSELRAFFENAGVRVFPVNGLDGRSFSLADVALFRRIFRRENPGILHTHAALSPRIAAKLVGDIPTVSTRHCAHAPTGERPLSRAKRSLYLRTTDITVSTARAATANLLAEGIPADRIFTVRNGTPPCRRTTEAERQALRTSLGIPPAHRILGCVGRLEWVKGQDLLLRATKKLIALCPDITLLIVGEGSERRSLEQLASLLGLRGRVKFLGYLDDPAPVQNLFSVNVSPSRGTETSSLAISECMSLGIPTVASDFGGNREMIRPGENGLLFSSDNENSLCEALARLCLSERLRTSLSDGARRRYQTSFTLETMVAEYRLLYRAIAKKHLLDKRRAL